MGESVPFERFGPETGPVGDTEINSVVEFVEGNYYLRTYENISEYGRILGSLLDEDERNAVIENEGLSALNLHFIVLYEKRGAGPWKNKLLEWHNADERRREKNYGETIGRVTRKFQLNNNGNLSLTASERDDLRNLWGPAEMDGDMAKSIGGHLGSVQYYSGIQGLLPAGGKRRHRQTRRGRRHRRRQTHRQGKTARRRRM
jgi:hypothetical protein